MNRLVHLAILCCIIGIGSSCEKDSFLSLNSPNTITFSEQGGTQVISFTTNRNWTVSSSESWCKVSPSSDLKSDGKVSLTITCGANPNYDSRSATVTIKAEGLVESITVNQDTKIGLFVAKNQYAISYKERQFEIDVESNVDYSISTDVDWLSVSDYGSISASYTVSVLENNDDTHYRVGHIVLSSIGGDISTTVTVFQDRAITGLFYSKEPCFSESMDLLSLIWRLAGAPEYNDCKIKTVSESADAFFASMKNHEAVRLASEYRNRGVSYDAVATYGLFLLLTDDGPIIFNPFLDGSDNSNLRRWPGNSKEEMLVALNDFYQKSDFHKWYKSLETLRGQAISSFKKRCTIDYDWFDHFYGPMDNVHTQIILSILNGYSSYGPSTDLSYGGKLCSPILGLFREDSAGDPYYAAGSPGNVIHEFSHAFCNPLIDKYWESMKDKANSLFPEVESLMRSMAYTDAKIMMYETLVRACTIRYLITHGYSKNKESLIQNEESRGFLLVRCVVDALEIREQNWSKYPTLDDFMPEIIKVVNDYQL